MISFYFIKNSIFEKARKTAKKTVLSTRNAACGGNSHVAALESELSDFAPANANRFPCAEGAREPGRFAVGGSNKKGLSQMHSEKHERQPFNTSKYKQGKKSRAITKTGKKTQ